MTDPRPPQIEDRLRAALAARADKVDPSPDGLARIEEKLMTDTRSTQKLVLGGLAAAVLIVVAFVIGLNVGDDDTGVVSDTSSTTEPESTTTTEPQTETTPAPTSTTEPSTAGEVDPFTVAWPVPGIHEFGTAEEAGEAYATDVLGFTRMTEGEYRSGDSRSGEYVISDREGGRETAILVRQMEDENWYVLGSQTPDIVVDTPTAREQLTSPFTTTGSALAFEGHVDIVILHQLDLAEVGHGFVTGSGTPPAGPFEGEIEFESQNEATPAILIFRTMSAEDGHVEMATSFTVTLVS